MPVRKLHWLSFGQDGKPEHLKGAARLTERQADIVARELNAILTRAAQASGEETDEPTTVVQLRPFRGAPGRIP
jgi:hypothetical protein